MEEEILNQIRILLKNKNLVIAYDAQMISSGLLTSLSVVELATWIESRYNVSFGDQMFNVHDFDSIDSIVNLIESLR